jgi:spore germination cell wall hydrolase CwlJ-like protein
MIRPVRAAALAVAFFALGAAAVVGGPVQAGEGDIAAVENPWFAHGEANAGVSALGLNDDAAATPATLVPGPRSLDEQVADQGAGDPAGADQECLANAVYFEARGESLEGQLAVAEVVLNRAASGRYPASLCGVVRQPAQFSFVRGGRMPRADRGSGAWRRAVAIARIAQAGARRMLPQTVLWYHANYVSPSWGRRLAMTSRIGAHVFYR